MKDKNFSINFKLIRETENKSQAIIAEALNVSIKTISHWETGYSEPSINQLIQLADYFDISLDDLVGRKFN